MPISDCGSGPPLISTIRNHQSAIINPQSAILHGPRGSRTHYLSIKSRELILMSFRPFRLRISDFRLRIRRASIRNPQSEIRNSSCSGRDSNSDHALIWCLQGISLLLCQLSYRSSRLQIADFGFRIGLALPESAIRNHQSAILGALVGTRTLLPGLRDLCFAIKASSAWRWRQDSNPRRPL